MQVYVENVERLNNSVNGNPKWELTVRCNGMTRKMKTASDSTAGYIVDWNCEGQMLDVDFHTTRCGNDIISYVYRG